MGKAFTRHEVIQRLRTTIAEGRAIVAAGAGTGISAKFVEKGGGDLIVIYNSGRYRMMGHGSSAGLLAFGDANAIVMEMGEREVLPVVRNTPVIAGVNGTDPTRRMDHFLKQVKEMGFSGVNNFPTVGVIDGRFRQTLEETGLGYYKEVEMIEIAHRMDLFTAVYVFNPEEAVAMTKAGADVIIAHVGTTVGGSIGVTDVAMGMDEAVDSVQAMADAARTVRSDVIFLCHGGPIATPEDVAYVLERSDCHGFVGASSIERLATEPAITELTRQFKMVHLSRESQRGES